MRPALLFSGVGRMAPPVRDGKYISLKQMLYAAIVGLKAHRLIRDEAFGQEMALKDLSHRK